MIPRNTTLFSLPIILVLIISIGSLLMYSASSSFAFYQFNKNDTYFLFKHVTWLMIGFLALFFAKSINYKMLKKYSKYLLIISWVIMIIPQLGNSDVARWLKIGNFTLMTTSDFAKICLIIFTANFIHNYYKNINSISILFKEFIPYLVITLVLIILQPDLSTSIVTTLLITALLFIAGIKYKIIFSSFLIGGTLAIIMIFFKYDYQKERLLSWIGFGNSVGNAQVDNSILALANGSMLGTGIGESTFKYNGFIPEGQTDFILAIIGEELGFLGIALLFFLFYSLFIKGMYIAKTSNDRFGMFLAAGLSINIIIYLVINASYVVGLLPTTGLPIPFSSYGGSQTIFTMLSIGILLNISNQNRQNKIMDYYHV